MNVNACYKKKRTIALTRYRRQTPSLIWEKFKILREEFLELKAKKQSGYSLNFLETNKSSRKTWKFINNLRMQKVKFREYRL